nr:hypothetical protein [Tanacetum cinerariifolium]
MCKAYGGNPNVELLGAFLNLGRASNSLTLSNRGETDVPKDVIPHQVREDPLYRLIATYHVSARTFSDPILYHAALKLHGSMSFVMDEIDGEFSFLPKETADNEGAGSYSFSINTETHATCVEPLSTADPFRFAKNTTYSDNFPSGKDDVVLIDISIADRLRNRKETRQRGKKLRLMEAKLQKGEDKERGELEAKCNDALQDLEKSHLILDLRGEIVTLQGQVEKLHGEYSRLVLEEKKGELRTDTCFPSF